MPRFSNQASHCFGFEQDFIGNWRCIPLCVRRKLDLIGLKLKLSHWVAMSQQQRQSLVDWNDHPEALKAMSAHCRSLTRTMADGEAKPLPPAQGESWQLSSEVAAHVLAAAEDRHIDLSLKQWHGLSELERFALCKLARPGGHDHHNLEAALGEVLG